MNNQIISWIKIKNNSLNLNHEVTEFQALNLNDLSLQYIEHFKIDYPKLFKMDILPRMCVISSSILLRTVDWDKVPAINKSVILMNTSSSFNADLAFQSTLTIEMPSPAKFVYTLPNIAIGEIAIHHQFKGFNVFYLQEKFDADFTSKYLNYILDANIAKCILSGWVEVYNDSYDLFLFLTRNCEEGILLNQENLNKLYSR